PKRTDGPRTTSTRSTASRGIRSKFTSSTVGSFSRTPSRNTLSPWGSPVTGEATNPRMVRSGWNGVPCSLWSVTPGSRSRTSSSTWNAPSGGGGNPVPTLEESHMTLTNRRTIWMMLPVVAALLAGCTTPTTEVPRTAALDTPDRVVTYPEGRYQLYGDGRITP